MDKKLLFTLYLVFVLCDTSVSQEICGTPVNLNQQLQSFSTKTSLAEDSSICLNIFFHIIRNDNGTGGINPDDLDAIVDNLNNNYNSHEIFFVNAGFDFINETNFVNIDDPNEAENLSQINNNSNAINYYVVETLWNTPTGFITGTAIEIPSNNLVIRRDRVLTSTSSHEVGHCLNLLHTFQGTAAGTTGCAENIDGSNCSTCGDEICDTPADANVGNASGFSPDLTNIMSYYNMRDHFTDGQSVRMKNSVINNNMLSQLMSNSCAIPELNGPNLICSGDTYTYNLDNPPAGVTWFTSTNLDIVNSTGSSITVKAASSNSQGEGFVTANYNNGAEATKTVYIGDPDIFTLNPDGTKNYMGRSFSYSFSHSTREIEVYSDGPSATYTWDMFPTNIQWQAVNNKATFYVNTPGNYVLTCRAENECGEELMLFTINIGSGYNYAYYPNPASSEITIENTSFDKSMQSNGLLSNTDKSKGSIIIYDFNGAVVQTEEFNINNQSFRLDISKLKPGKYFMKIGAAREEEIHQIVIRR